eukprot:jgi/Chlat1/7977/Chrsp69S07402
MATTAPAPGRQDVAADVQPQQPQQQADSRLAQQLLPLHQGIVCERSFSGRIGRRVHNEAHDNDTSIGELERLMSKLNPAAQEFVPPRSGRDSDSGSNKSSKGSRGRRGQRGEKQPKPQTLTAEREDSIRRTVYVSDIDQQVTEEQLAALFSTCGQVVDCRVCGDPNRQVTQPALRVLRFAFVEFSCEASAWAALGLAGTVLGYYPVRVLPSKTAILPVNPTYLPQSKEERGQCARTVYVANIDKKVNQQDVKAFFEQLCGEVSRSRLLGDYDHDTRIAFVEFVLAESAMAALNCSGAILGSMPIRVSPSKTPVRQRSPRQQHHHRN